MAGKNVDTKKLKVWPYHHLLTVRDDYRDFHYRIEAKIADGANSGQIFRNQSPENGYYIANIDCTGVTPNKTGSLFFRDRTGVGEVLKKIPVSPVPPDTWFTQEVIAGSRKSHHRQSQWRNDGGSRPHRQTVSQRPPWHQLGRPGKQDLFPQDRSQGTEKPPSDFTPLFNGKDLTGWKTLPGDRCAGKLKDGNLTGSGPVGDPRTLTKRTSRTSTSWPKPASTTAATAACISGPSLGVGFPKGYEGQINSTHKDPIRTGSLYPAFDLALTIEQKKKFVVKEMLVKPGEWFTQEVIAQGNHIVIKVNDKTTVDFIDEKNHPKGPFALQQHHDGSVVEFRRIEVKGLPAAQEAGFVPLFNGKDLTGWGDITHYWHRSAYDACWRRAMQGLPKNMFLLPKLLLFRFPLSTAA